MRFLQRFLSLFRSQPDLEFIAGQLRKPSGSFAEKIAEKMDTVNAPLFELTLDNLELTDHESVLEIGFGSGAFFRRIFGEADGLAVSGIDYSGEMVKRAMEANSGLISSSRLTLKKATSSDIPFPDGLFDKVFCNMVIYFWDRPAIHLQEIHRVLKPGGRFYTGIRSKTSMQQLPFTKHGFNLYDSSKWRTLLEENGFEVTRIARKNDPAIELEGKEIQMESICMVAQKKLPEISLL